MIGAIVGDVVGSKYEWAYFKSKDFELFDPDFYNIYMFKRFYNYCKESYEELVHKTTWPTRSELFNSAIVVLSASLLIAVVVFVMDFCFQHVMELIYPN